MLYILAVALIAFWAIGLFFEVASGIIHLALVAALIVFAFSFFTGRRGGRRSTALP